MRQLDNVAGFLMAKGEPSHVELEQQQVEDILASVAVVYEGDIAYVTYERGLFTVIST